MKNSLKEWAPLPLRLMLGYGFIFHGFPKVFSSEGHTGFVGMLQGIGIPMPELMAWVVGIVEVLGGLALIVGAFVLIAGGLLTINMLVAMFAVHLPNGFNFMNITGMTDAGMTFGLPGFEVNLLYIAGLVALMLGGAGIYSIDRMLAEKRAKVEISSPAVEAA